jgi:hypothetical protein
MNANDFRFYSPSTATPAQGFVPNYNVTIPGVNAPLPAAMPSGPDLAKLGTAYNPMSGGYTGEYAPLAQYQLGANAAPDVGAKSATGLMGMLRGQAGVAGDGLVGWLGKGENMQTALGGIQALTGAYLGFQNLRVAKDNLRFQKDAWAKNYANQAQSYNTSLEDRVRARYSASSSDESRIQDYLNRNRLSKN